MSYETGGLKCVAGSGQSAHWAYHTNDAPAEVLAPGYFSGENMHLFPGYSLTITCWPDGRRTHNTNPVMVVSGVMARTQDGVWLFLMTHTPVWPGVAAEASVKAILAALFPGRGDAT